MLQTGIYDINGVMVEEMDVVRYGNEYGLITFNETLDAFIFANDYMTEYLEKLDDIEVILKHSKLDEKIDALTYLFGY